MRQALPGADLSSLFTAPGWPLLPVVQWLIDSARDAEEPAAFLGTLAERLTGAGAPLLRIRLALPLLHPEVRSFGYLWLRGKPVEFERVGHEMVQSEAYYGSPMEHLVTTGTPFRRRLDALQDGRDHPVLFEIRAQGGTDYLALPMRALGRPSGALVFVTDRAGGFDEHDVLKLEALASFVLMRSEVHASRVILHGLLDTYLGPRIGGRVLSGQFRRGAGESLEAAIWFSDVRDFTPLTESLSPEALIATLNDYFELVAAAVTARKGEILRFIGDAMLIVFPTGEGSGIEAACEAALESAQDAFASLDVLNQRRRRAGKPPLRFGVGLHEGQVVYGNVGARERLDFTVMGPAVNRAARIESLTKDLGTPLLFSAEFARRVAQPVRSLGRHALKGVGAPQEVFTLS